MANFNHSQTLKIHNFLLTNLNSIYTKHINSLIQDYTKYTPEEEIDIDEFIHNYLSTNNSLHLISLSTGELIQIINFQDIINNRATKPYFLPSGEKNLGLQAAGDRTLDDIEKEMERGYAGLLKYIEDLDKKIKELEEDEDEWIMDGFFQGKGNNKMKDGICRHHPDAGGFWSKSYFDKNLVMTNEEGEVTDEFYGGQNDFNATVIAMASRGKKFSLEGYDKKVGRWHKVTELHLVYCSEKFILKSNADGSWKLVSRKAFA